MKFRLLRWVIQAGGAVWLFSMGDRGAEFQLRVPLKLPRDILSQRLPAGDNELSIRLVVATATQPPRLSRPAKRAWHSTGNIPSTRGQRVRGVLRMLVGPQSRQGRICNTRGADCRLHHFLFLHYMWARRSECRSSRRPSWCLLFA